MQKCSRYVGRLFFSFVFILCACAKKVPTTPDVLMPAVMINDVIYYSTGYSIMIHDEEASGVITSVVSETMLPLQNDEANNAICLNSPYCITEEGVAVFMKSEWVLFKEDETGD